VSTILGALAIILAMVGLYSILANAVAQRTREIGIRMALGANAGSVVWLVMREVMTLAAIGLAIGLPAAWALARRDPEATGTPSARLRAGLAPVGACVLILWMLTSITREEWRVAGLVVVAAVLLYALTRKGRARLSARLPSDA